MDVYHKILVRLFETTGGKQSESADLVELVKDEGFFPSYDDIHRQLSRAGWIADTGRGNKVKITHWGIKEAKKSSSGTLGSTREVEKLAKQLREEAKALLVMTEELIGDATEDKLKQAQKQLDAVTKRMEELGASI